MAYLARIVATDSQPIALPAIVGGASATAEPAADFSALDWSVIRLTANDRLWTIRPAGRVRRFWNWLQGRGNLQLANDRLEALRRMAVLSRHYGYTVPGEDVADFLAAGFTLDQYELLVSSIRRAASAPTRRFPREVLA